MRRLTRAHAQRANADLLAGLAIASFALKYCPDLEQSEVALHMCEIEFRTASERAHDVSSKVRLGVSERIDQANR